MATTFNQNKCHLLALPREIRNQIYNHISAQIVVSKHHTTDDANPSYRPEIILTDPRTPAMLFLNRQIYNEYSSEILTRELRISMSVHFENAVHFRLDESELRLSRWFSLLEKVREVHFTVNWTAVMEVANARRFGHWFMIHTPQEFEAQELMGWTPSKNFCIQTRTLLNHAKELLPNATLCTLNIKLKDFLFPDHPYPLSPGSSAKPSLDQHKSESLLQKALFYPPTIFSLEQGDSIHFSAAKQLQVNCWLETPLWCSVARNSAEVRENRRALREGETEYVLQPEFEEAGEVVRWSVAPAGEREGWNGLWPEMVSVVKKSSEVIKSEMKAS